MSTTPKEEEAWQRDIRRRALAGRWSSAALARGTGASGPGARQHHVLVVGAGNRGPGQRVQRVPVGHPRRVHQQGQRQHRVRGAQDGAGSELGCPGHGPDRVPAPAVVHRPRRAGRPRRVRRQATWRTSSCPGPWPRSRRADGRLRLSPGRWADDHDVQHRSSWTSTASRCRRPGTSSRRRPRRSTRPTPTRTSPTSPPTRATSSASCGSRGRKPFTVDGTNITIDFTSPEVDPGRPAVGRPARVGDLAPVDTYSPDWNTALGNGTIACWTSGAWGPQVIEPAAPDLSGKWQAYQMPHGPPARPSTATTAARRSRSPPRPSTRPRPRHSTAG